MLAIKLFILKEKLNQKYIANIKRYSSNFDLFIKKYYKEEERFSRIATKSNYNKDKDTPCSRGSSRRGYRGIQARSRAAIIAPLGLRLYLELPKKFKNLPRLDPTTR